MDKLGRYPVTKSIGEGGFGVVYKATHPLMKRDVAIKVLHSHMVSDPQIRERFLSEANMMYDLAHPNITKVHDIDVNEADGSLFIVMEFLTGSSLRTILDSKVFIPLSKKLVYARQVSDALAYLHREGIIHRDVKPENVQLLDDGNIKLMDFGIAKSHDGQSPRTQTGLLIGSPNYMAPEQFRGVPDPDGRIDIFSFGAVFYELITGEQAFPGDANSAPYKVVNEQPAAITKAQVDGEKAIIRIIDKCLEKDRNKRYERFEQIVDALNDVHSRYSEQEEKQGAVKAAKVEALLKDCKTHRRRGNLTKAFLAIKEAAELAPDDRSVLNVMSEVQQELDNKRAIADKIDSASKSIAGYDYETGARLIQEVLEQEPKNKAATQLLKQLPRTKVLSTHGRQPDRGRQTSGPPGTPTNIWLKGMLVVLSLSTAFVIWLVVKDMNFFVPGEGYVRLNVLPWAEIVSLETMDGEPVETYARYTPCQLTLSPDTYNMTVRNKYFANAQTITFEVTAGTTIDVVGRGFDALKFLQ